MKNKRILLLVFIVGLFNDILQSQSQIVYPDATGKLTYKSYTKNGDIIPDFSYCGYMGSTKTIPTIKVVETLNGPSGENDDTRIIQHLIDKVAKRKPDKEGFRGTILLKKGTYKIASPIKITASGIVLRGEGNSSRDGTVLLATTPQKYSVIEIGVNAGPQAIKESINEIFDTYVPSGTKIVHVKNASDIYRKGDCVIIHRPSTAKWIHAIGMDSIPPRPLKGETTKDALERFRLEGQTDMNGTIQWEDGSKDLLFERTIEAIDGDKITLDIPLTNALQKEYGGAKIYKYEFKKRISQCGIENIYGISIFDKNITSNNPHIGTYYSDEKHADTFIKCNAVENAWIRNISVEHFDCLVNTSYHSKFITGQDLSAVNPVSEIIGGRRYAYSVSGQMILFIRCHSSHHRHGFVLQGRVAGPNAFVEGVAEMSFASCEPHQRWATGCLFDNIKVSGPDGSLLSVNRNWFGSGHGWAGAQILFWNCSAPLIMVMQPPTAHNFAIGLSGKITDEWSDKVRCNTVQLINNVSLSNFEDNGDVLVGCGWIESPEKKVYPESLYQQQLNDRIKNKE